MKHIGLFEGIGGFSLAAEWAGWETIAWCEINPFCQKVLSYHFPKAKQHHDIKTTDFTIYRGQCDILTGGFPCQPYSLAGKRKGKEDDRHLWPEMLRAVREIQPTWIVGENVFGLVNWDGGVVFNEVQTDLEAEGYEVQPYILPACAVNAPHRRDRVWFVAKNTRSNGCRDGKHEKQGSIRNEWEFSTGSEKRDTSKKATPNSNLNGQHRCNGENEVNTSEGGEYAQRNIEQMGGDAADTYSSRRGEDTMQSKLRANIIKQSPGNSRTSNQAKNGQRSKRAGWEQGNQPIPNWDNFPTQPPVRGRNDGFSRELDGITFPRWRNESIKAYGNAIVPQVAYQIFKAINAMNKAAADI